jgi:hypothetical protein
MGRFAGAFDLLYSPPKPQRVAPASPNAADAGGAARDELAGISPDAINAPGSV